MSEKPDKPLTVNDLKFVHDWMTEHHDALTNYIHKNVDHFKLVEEAFQETYLQILAYFHTQRDREDFQAWVLVIASNVCLRVNTRIKNDQKKHDGYYERHKAKINELYHNLNPLEIMIREERLQAILKAVDELPMDCQAICYDFHFAHKTVAELSGEHKISERAIKAKLAKARKLLRFKTRDLVLVGLTLRLLQSNQQGFWGTAYAQAGTLPLEIPSSLLETSPAVLETVTDNAPQMTETVAAGGGAVATVAKSIPSFLLTASMPFLWLMSAVIGGQVCGLAFVRNAPTMPVRRWLVKQLFLCYCFMMLVPVFYFAISPFFSQKIDDDRIGDYLIYLSIGGVLVFGFLWLKKLKKKYRLLVEGSSSPSYDFRKMQRFVYGGYTLLTIVLLVSFLMFLLLTAVPCYQRCIQSGQLNKSAFIAGIITASIVAFLWVHLSTFFLFRYFLSICKDDQVVAPPIPTPSKVNNARFVSWNTFWELAYMSFFVILTLIPSALHIWLTNKRPGCAVAELTAFSFCWLGVLSCNTKNPCYRWRLIFITFFILVAIMATLRSTIYE